MARLTVTIKNRASVTSRKTDILGRWDRYTEKFLVIPFVIQLATLSSFRLSDNLSVYHAELLAYISIGRPYSAFMRPKILILSDSLSSLLDIYNGFSYKFPEILNSLVSSVIESPITFSFC